MENYQSCQTDQTSINNIIIIINCRIPPPNILAHHAARLWPQHQHPRQWQPNHQSTISISGMTPTWLTTLHHNCLQEGIHLEGGWSVPLQKVGNFHIAELPVQASVTMNKRMFRETYIFLQVTTIVGISTACGRYFTEAAI